MFTRTPVAHVERDRADPGRAVGVLVRLGREPQLEAGGGERVGDRVRIGAAGDRQRAGGAVQRVGLAAVEHRAQRVGGPQVVAQRRPAVAVGPGGADEVRAVERAGPADHLAARHRPADAVGQLAGEVPVRRVPRDGGAHRGGVPDRGREVLGTAVVGAGLQQQHRPAGVHQPGGQGAPGRAGAHHDDVRVAHRPRTPGRSSRRTLPVEVRGSSSSRCADLGRLAGASRSRAQAASSAGVGVPT